jgi:hypothetical protein
VTDWEGCEISAFEATTGATVEVKGSLSPNISRLTNLEIAADNNLLSNDVVDYEALERESARARLIFNIIFGIGNLVLDAFKKVFPPLEGAFGQIQSMIGSVGDYIINSASELGAFVDDEMVIEQMTNAVESTVYSNVEFPIFTLETTEEYYALVNGWNQLASRITLPDDICQPVPRTADLGSVFQGVSGRNFTGDNFLGFRDVATQRNEWFTIDPFKSLQMVQRGSGSVSLWSTKWEDYPYKSDITGGLNGGKLEYDFELEVPFPTAWVTSNGVGVPENDFNAILIDNRVYAWYDTGGGFNDWRDFAAFFIVG